MSAHNQTTISIENQINPVTKLPFGSKYAGSITIRRASLLDKTIIAQKDAAERNRFGVVNSSQLPPGLELAAYIDHYVTTVAIGDLPSWFDRSLIFDDSDEAAFGMVWDEVQKFVDSFRAVTDNQGSNEAVKEPSVLVQAAL